MADVLEITGAGTLDPGAFTAVDDMYVSIDVYFPAATLAAWQAGGAAGAVANFYKTGVVIDGVFLEFTSSVWRWDYYQSGNLITASAVAADTWHTLQAHYQNGTLNYPVAKIDSTLHAANSGDTYVDQTDDVRVGNLGTEAVPLYLRNFQVGTSGFGSTELVDDDLSTGGNPDWYTGPGDFAVAPDPAGPSPPPATPEGVLIAFTDSALAPNPDFTRIDNIQGVNVASINVKRGRPDERSKTGVGTAEITGFDMVGDTDPTNTSGPWYGNLDPMKQAAVNLYNPTTGDWSPIYTGYTSVWAHVLDVSEKKLDFTLDLVDMLDLLNAAEVVPDQAGNTVPGESKGDCYYALEHVDDRLYAVLADAGTALLAQVWPPALLRINSGNVDVQPRVYANRTTLLQVIDEACDAEGPGVTNRFVDVAGVFNFIGRYPRYVPDSDTAGSGNTGTARFYPGGRLLHWYVGDIPAWEADDTLAVYTGLEFTRDGTNLINASLVTPLGIADGKISAQFVYDSTSVGQYGPRTEGTSYENIITGAADDGNDPYQETKSYGQATVDNYKDPVTRVSKLVFRNPPAGASAARAFATWQLLCNIELSDWITITSTHPGGGGFTAVDHFVEGITYQISPLRGDEWDVMLTLDLSPRAYYATMPDSWNPPVPGALMASFSDFPQTGVAPLDVAFTDTSTPGPSGPIVSWAWDFGDGGTSTSENPTYTFNDAGTWKVVLTVTGTGTDGTSSFSRYVHAVA